MIKKDTPVSILLVSYNHEKYIRQALDSLFGQVFDGQIEFVIADDNSSDSTASIIKEYDGKDSRFRFKFLVCNENLGVTRNYKRGFAACTTEFVAVLEGDDYWISPHKLKRQLDFLVEHWECDVCSVNYWVYEQDRAHFTPRVPIANRHRFITARELIADNVVGNFSTCLYRRAALSRLPDALFDIQSYDWITHIVLARTSLVGFIEEPMSVYRLHSKGVWSQMPNIKKIEIQLKLLPAYDALTDHVFHENFKLLADQLRRAITSSQIGHAVETCSQPVIRSVPALVNYMPPILVVVLKSLVPVALKNFILRLVKRSLSV